MLRGGRGAAEGVSPLRERRSPRRGARRQLFSFCKYSVVRVFISSTVIAF